MTQTTYAASDTAGDSRIDRPTASSSMMAWRVHEYGPPDVMKFEQIPTAPIPGPGEVLLKVKAAGVGPWDGYNTGGARCPAGTASPDAGLGSGG